MGFFTNTGMSTPRKASAKLLHTERVRGGPRSDPQHVHSGLQASIHMLGGGHLGHGEQAGLRLGPL